MNLIYFLGRLHVLVLHLPIAFVLIVALVEWLARRERFAHLRGSLPLLWAATALSAIITVLLGYFHFSEGGFTGPSAIAHRFLGTTVAVIAVAGWILRTRSQRVFSVLRLPICAALVVLVTLTGHFGGNLTHGDTFLVEYAPGPIRSLAGLQQARRPITDPARADPFLDVVAPILNARCMSCHNGDKKRGGLDVTSFASLMKGGEAGPVIVAGVLDKSDLWRRINLPREDKDAMPAEGKAALTAGQMGVIRWWIASGAKTGVTIEQLHPDKDSQALIVAQLGGASAGSAGAATAAASQPTQATRSADAALIAKFEAAGFAVRQVSENDPRLILRSGKDGAAITPEQLGQLGSAADQIVQISLPRDEIADAGLDVLKKLDRLTHLRLDNNRITDAGVARLEGALPKVVYLNLYGNSAITDASIESLSKLPSLREVYLWGTGVTPAGIERLKKLRPQLRVDSGT